MRVNPIINDKNKVLFIIPSLVIYFILSSSVFSIEPDKKLHTNCIYPTVLVVDKIGSYSTGVVLKSKKVGDEYHNIGLTADHGSLTRKITIQVFEYENYQPSHTSKYDGITYYGNKFYDLSVFVFISEKEISTAKTANKNIPTYMGQAITKVACGLGDPPRVDLGIVSGKNRLLTHSILKKMQLSIFTLPGDSGSAIFDENREIIGWTQSIRTIPDQSIFNVAYAIPVDQMHQMLELAKLDFVLNEEELPVLPWLEIKINSNKNNRAIPINPWLNMSEG